MGGGGVIQFVSGDLPLKHEFMDHANTFQMSSNVPAVTWDFLMTINTKRLAAVEPVPRNEFHVKRYTDSCLEKLPASPCKPRGMVLCQSSLGKFW